MMDLGTRSWACFWMVFALSMAFAVTARAQTDEKKEAAKEEFNKGAELFANEQYPQAATRFQAAYDLYPDPAYLYNLGASHQRAESWRDAVVAFDSYLEVAGADLSDKLRAEVTRLRDLCDKAHKGRQVTVVCESAPAGAQAKIEGPKNTYECKTPCSVKTEPGLTVVTFKHEGATRVDQATTGPGDTWTAKADLMALEDDDPRGTLVVNVDLDGVTVQVGGKTIAVGAVVELPPGTYVVRVTHPEHPVRMTEVLVAEGKEAIENVQLLPVRDGPSGQSVAGWTLLGVGGATLIAGAVMGGLALKAQSDAEGLATDGPFDADGFDRFNGSKNAAKNRALTADILFGVAAASLTTGLLLWLLDGDE